jgi:predicted Zn-dependent peptidase
MEFKKTKLKNGLVILHEKRDLPVTTVMLGVRYGSGYEDEKEKGIAHFIEHLCFKGTEKRKAREIAFELEKIGGVLNAFTSEEETAYHVKLPSNHLEIAMDVIFDIFFNPIFPEKDVKKEAKVICEEIKMYHDSPIRYVFEKIKSCLYKEPFGMFTAGSEEVIKKMTREQLLEKHKKIYSPENSILCVVGNNEFDEVVRLAEKFCIEKQAKIEKPKIPKIELKDLKQNEKRDGLQQANLCIGFHFPKASEKEKYAGEVFETILGGGMSSKLFTEIREKRGLVYAIKTDLDIGKNYGYLIIYAGTDKEKTQKVIDICLKEFENMKNLTEKQLKDGKQQVIGKYDVNSEDSNTRAVNLFLEEISGNGEDYYKFKENIEKISLEDIKKLAEKTEYSSFVLSP